MARSQPGYAGYYRGGPHRCARARREILLLWLEWPAYPHALARLRLVRTDQSPRPSLTLWEQRLALKVGMSVRSCATDSDETVRRSDRVVEGRPHFELHSERWTVALDNLRIQQRRSEILPDALHWANATEWKPVYPANAARLAESRRGRILSWLRRRLSGLRFWFTKPLNVPVLHNVVGLFTGPDKPRPHHPEAELRPVHPRVLIVEDESPIRDLLTDTLEEEGYGLEVAASVEEAELRIADEPPDLILLDLRLPGRSGWDFLRHRHDDPMLAAIPVLVLSAAPEDRLLEAKELGADGFLSKPLDLDILSALVRSYAH